MGPIGHYRETCGLLTLLQWPIEKVVAGVNYPNLMTSTDRATYALCNSCGKLVCNVLGCKRSIYYEQLTHLGFAPVDGGGQTLDDRS